MKVYLIYTGNTWLSKSSLMLIAVATTHDKAVELITQDAVDNDERLCGEDIDNLRSFNQTYNREVNYLIVPYTTDTL